MGLEWRIAREGIVAGLVGAATVAFWFLIVDAIRGEPFRTPSVLGAVIFQGARDPGTVAVALGPVLGYTVIHVLAFIAFGVVAALLTAGAEREPAMLLALLIFFAAFEVFFLALVAFVARPVLGVVVWWEILIGNLLAAVTMLAYFFLAHRALARTLLGRWVDVLREGVVAGVLAGAVVAVWFLIFDTLATDPLRTPGMLGAAVFQGLRDPNLLAGHPPDLDVVLGYTVIHFVAFIGFGVLVAALLLAAEREPRILLGLFILFWCFEIFFLGAISVLDAALLGVLGWWNVAIGNLLAAAAMLVYFFLGHRSLGARLFERWTED